MKDPPTGRLFPTTCLLSEVLVIIILRGHLHEVSSCARVEVVVHFNGRSGKTVKAEKKNRGEIISLQYNYLLW